MKPASRWYKGVIWCLALVCASRSLAGLQRMQGVEVALDVAARSAVLTWLECQECKESELGAVVNLGDLSVSHIRTLLMEGPPHEKKEELRRHLEQSYTELKQYYGDKLTYTKERYLEEFGANYKAAYQMRSITALTNIGTENAHAVLREARGMVLRPDVREALESSLNNFQ